MLLFPSPLSSFETGYISNGRLDSLLGLCDGVSVATSVALALAVANANAPAAGGG